MPMLILQLALLIAVAFIIGAMIGRARSRKQQGVMADEKIITAAALAQPKADNAKVEDLSPPVISKVSGSIDKTKLKTQKIEEKPATKKATLTAKPVPDAEPVGPAQNVVSLSESAVKSTKRPSKTKDKPPAAVEKPKTKPDILKAPRDGKADDLMKIKGIGVAIQNKLNNVGIYHYDQLIDLNADQQKWLGEQINFRGRVEREEWVAQAKKILKSTQPKATKKDKTAIAAETKTEVKKTAAKRKRKPQATGSKQDDSKTLMESNRN